MKLIEHPDGQGRERYVLCRSLARHQKEAAMLRRQRDRLRVKLLQIDASLKKRPQRPETVERRIGKWLGRNTAAERVFQVQVITASGNAVGLRIEEDEGKLDWAEAAQGAYLPRTNCFEQDPRTLWRRYIQLTDVEDAFRVGKSDLGLRPVYHHREDRVQAHILVCFLALAMWRCLETWLQSRGQGNCGRQICSRIGSRSFIEGERPSVASTRRRAAARVAEGSPMGASWSASRGCRSRTRSV
ncbi:MAG TPA: hypothetical protein VN317_00460 [Candidatus Methanoperedens sp.]|nr:hypothetical protein [Candidatus Methanoperedens sp.]